MEKKNKNIPEMHQSYNCDGTVVLVEPVFKTTGERTLFYSLGQMVHRDINDSEQS